MIAKPEGGRAKREARVGFRSLVQNGYTSLCASRNARQAGHPAAAVTAVLHVDCFYGRSIHLDGHRCGFPKASLLLLLLLPRRDDEKHEKI